MSKLNKRKCKNCKEVFQKKQPLQFVCSPKCGIEYNRKDKDKKMIKQMKENLLTHKDYIKMFQVVFNAYIRKRDADKPCISCGTTANVKYDAGHFYPTTYQYLRFNEDNVHKQCSNNCNLHKHGNFQEYAPRLEERIGFERVQKLHNDRHKRLELSIPELKELIKEYKLKTKQL